MSAQITTSYLFYTIYRMTEINPSNIELFAVERMTNVGFWYKFSFTFCSQRKLVRVFIRPFCP